LKLTRNARSVQTGGTTIKEEVGKDPADVAKVEARAKGKEKAKAGEKGQVKEAKVPKAPGCQSCSKVWTR